MIKKVFLFVLFVLVISCSEDSHILNQNSTTSLEKRARNITVSKWKLDHYTNNSTHRIGIWPRWSDGASNVPVDEYKNKFAFTDILAQHTDQFNISSNYFSRWNIMVKISNNGWWKSQISGKSVTRYYYDEPLEHPLDPSNGFYGCDVSLLEEIHHYIDSVGQSRGEVAHFYISSALRESLSHPIIQSYKNFIGWRSPKVYLFFSSYGEGSGGQQYWWEQYKHWSYYGTHSLSNWIGAYFDRYQYSSLLNKANSLGLKHIWYYIGGDGGAERVAEFAYHLWEKGWLNQRVEREFKYHYYYTGENPPAEYDPNDPNWRFEYCESTSNTRTANRSYYSSFPSIDNDVCTGTLQ